MTTATLEDEIETARIAYETAALDNSPDVDRLREELRVLTARAGDTAAAARAKLRRDMERTAQQQQRRRRAAIDEARKAMTAAQTLAPKLQPKLDELLTIVKELRGLNGQARAAIARASGSNAPPELMYYAFLSPVDFEHAVVGDPLGHIHPLGPRIEQQLSSLARLIPQDEA